MDNRILKLINKHEWIKIIDLIRSKKWSVDKIINNGNNIAHYAALNNQPILMLIINTNADTFKIINDDGYTPLHILAKYGYVDLLKEILKLNNKLINLQNNTGDTVIHLLYNDFNFIKWLNKNIKSVDYDRINDNGSTILTMNIIDGNDDIVIYIINTLKVNINIPEMTPPLNIALYEKNKQISKYLINKGADVNIIDGNYLSPIILAAKNKYDDIVKLLIDRGADINYSGPSGEDNPLNIAIKNNDDKIVDLLLDNGAITDKIDHNMNTPLHNGINDDSLPSIIAKLIYHTDVNKKNVDGITPIKLLRTKYPSYYFNKILEHIKTKNNESRLKHPAAGKSESKLKHIKKLHINSGRFNADSLHSIIYMMILLKKYPMIGIPLQNRIDDKITNTKIQISCNNMYKDPYGGIITDLLDIYVDICFEMLPYLILWNNKDQYYISEGLDYYTKKCLLSDEIRFIIYKLTLIVSTTGTHANILIYDKINRTLERFEPYGMIPYLDPDIMDNVLEMELCKIIGVNGIKYMNPKTIMNNISFQNISKDSKTMYKKLGDPPGYCLAWTLWYLEMRVNNCNLTPQEIVSNNLTYIVNTSNSTTKFIDFIRDYANKMDNDKNNYMLSAGINENNIYKYQLSIDDQNKIKKKLSDDIQKIIKSKYIL